MVEDAYYPGMHYPLEGLELSRKSYPELRGAADLRVQELDGRGEPGRVASRVHSSHAADTDDSFESPPSANQLADAALCLLVRLHDMPSTD